MRVDERRGGAVPALGGAELLARAPGLGEIADLEPVDWGLVSASHFAFDQLLELAGLVRAALDRPDVDGAVLVQGTDTIEETSFLYDLLHRSSKPLVIVGAMRNADQPGYEGPANLRDAIRCAVDPRLQGQGVVVAMGGTVHAADDVTKTHTEAYATFQSLNFGPLATIDDGGIVVLRRRERRRSLGAIPDAAAEPVLLVTAVIGERGDIVRLALERDVRGIVVAATGAGNTTPELLAACRDAMAQGVPVVITTRCPSGRARPAYGFPGGGMDWAHAGAIFAGHLGGPKARIALALGVGAGLDEPGLRELFAE